MTKIDLKARRIVKYALTMGLLGTLISASALVSAAPYIPEDDHQIIEQLPLRLGNVNKFSQLRQMHKRLRRDPANLELAVELAWRYTRIGRQQADPRFLGYAQAVLAPWWKQSTPPAEVLMLRATLRQNRHDYTGALKDLSQLLKRQPRHRQALLTRAVVQQVIGDYSGAMRSCYSLLWLSNQIVSSTCISSILSLTGQAEQAYQLLQSTLVRQQQGNIEERQWALTQLAEISQRLGRLNDAEKYYRRALLLEHRSIYLLSSYADFLLAQHRPQQVQALLTHETATDALLLRLVLAEQQLGAPEFSMHAADIKARFVAARLRQSSLHTAAEARYALAIEHDAQRALELARLNWQTQREPSDAQLLLEAALAAEEPDAALPVLSWLERTSLQDAAIKVLKIRLQHSLESRESEPV